ncbi:unnamed protein product [Clavelina lepadiformis]|uniref:B-cell lymphoma 9 beta-catenin binding domain-containing protein n=1 Tax=Clavelina lepadiformis TaxID=159417 RepID=A0ABP0F9V4_CLALP
MEATNGINLLNAAEQPVLALTGNGGGSNKLKGNSGIAASPGNAYTVRTQSPLSGIGNNGRRSTSPYSGFPIESKSEEMVLSKNGSGQTIKSFSSTEMLPNQSCVTTTLSSAAVCANARSTAGTMSHAKRDGLKITIRRDQNESRILSNHGGVPSPVEGKVNHVTSRRELCEGRSEKLNHLTNEKGRNSTLTRSASVSKSRPNAGNVNCIPRRYGSVDERDTCTGARPLINSAKFEKGVLRNSPRGAGEYASADVSCRNMSDHDSPFNSYPSPSSNENAISIIPSKGKLKGVGTPGVTAHHTNSRISRTSSSNSVSDLSPCSEVTDESATHSDTIQSTSAGEIQSTNTLFQTECNNPINPGATTGQLSSPFDVDTEIMDVLMSKPINTEQTTKNQTTSQSCKLPNKDRLQSDKIGLSLDDVDTFPFQDTGSASDDISTDALNLSVEDIQRTLNSVSAENALPEMTIPQNTDTTFPSDFGSPSLQTDILSQSTNSGLNFDGGPTDMLSTEVRKSESPSLTTVSMAESTSLTTTIITTAVSSATDVTSSLSKLASSTMASSITSKAFTSEPYPSSNCSSAASTPASFSTSCSTGGTTRSHLQEILGVTDTNRLLNMTRPVDSIQCHSTTSTSFSSNIMKTNVANPYSSRSSSMSDRPTNQIMSVTSPSTPLHNISPHSRFGASANNNAFQKHPMHQRMSNPHPNHGQVGHNFDPTFHGGPREQSPGFGDHPGLSRPGMQYDQAGVPQSHFIMQGGANPYNTPSPSHVMPGNQLSWQRQGSVGGGMMSPHGPMGVDEIKSPRGQIPGGVFPHRSINPMSGLQSTVDSIPHPNCMAKNNNNNMGPPLPGQGIPTSIGLGEFNTSQSPLLPRPMLPPPSPSLPHDKRSISLESTLSSGSGSRKGSKRERGHSVDSKDGDKKEPKSKRRKSKSKDDSKKSESKANSRSNSASDSQSHNLYLYIFNSELANNASSMVVEQKVSSIIAYHQSFKGNCRLMPSKPGSLPIPPSNNHGNYDMRSPTGTMTTSTSNGGRDEIKPGSRGQLPSVASVVSGKSPNIKMEGTSMISPEGTKSKPDEMKTGDPVDIKQVKSEPDSAPDLSNPAQNASPSTQSQVKKEQEEDLSDEKRRHREKSLSRIKQMKSLLLPEHEQGTPSFTTASAWPSQAQSVRSGNYDMSRHLEKVQKTMAKDNQVNTTSCTLTLVTEYNKERRRKKGSHNTEAIPREGIQPDQPPPPYNPGGPNPVHQKWMHPIREPGPPDMPTSGFPHPVIRSSMRLPHDGGRMHPGFPHNRYPRGYPGGPPGNRMVYQGPQPAGLLPRTSGPRIHHPHPMSQANEAYPFSEKLKEQASIYRSDGMHPQPGHPGFDLNTPGDPNMGPRMGPDWPPYGPNSANMPLPSRTTRMPESISPSHGPMGPSNMMMQNPAVLPGQVIEPPINPAGDAIDPGVRIHNPGMVPGYTMPPFASKASNSLPNYPEQAMMTPHGPNMPGGIPDMSSHGGMMDDAMARRGEPRPPDLNLNSGIPRSPLSFQARHPAPSPGMLQNPGMGSSQPFMPGDMGPGGLPQVSPLHPSMPQSPAIMNSPVNNQMSYMPVGQQQMPGMQQMPMEQPNMMPHGPSSAGPNATPNDWGVLPQTSMGVKDPASPPPLSHINGNPNPLMGQEPPPLSHNPNPMDPGAMQMGSVNSGMMMRNPAVMTHSHPVVGGPPGYDPIMSGPRSAGSRPGIGTVMGDNFGGDFRRPPSHSGMCVSPSMQGGLPQNMLQQGMIEMHGPQSGFMTSQANMMPGNPSNSMPGHPNDNQANSRNIPTKFDLSGIIPTEKPSQTLSYFPSGGSTTQENPPMETVPNSQIPMSSPSMPQQPMNRYPNMNMGQQPLTPGSASYMANNPAIRMAVPGNYIGSNPPNYPIQGAEGYMSPSRWDQMSSNGMVRPQNIPNNGPNMHPSFQNGGRSLI